MVIDLLINGNLICSGSCKGHIIARLPSCNSNFDISQAIIIEGDVHVEDFYAAGKIVGVTGYATAKTPRKELKNESD